MAPQCHDGIGSDSDCLLALLSGVFSDGTCVDSAGRLEAS